MKKKVIISISVLMSFVIAWIIGSRLIKRENVLLQKEPVSQDSDKLSGQSEKIEESKAKILENRIAEKLNSMTLEEKIAQLFIVTPEVQSAYPVGGVIFFEEDIVSEAQVTEKTERLQQDSQERIGLPIFISVDEEGGSVARIASNRNMDVARLSDMCEVGATGDAQKAYEAGDIIGSYLSRLGFNLDFAPVADVWTNPDNTVVKKRSFGSEPHLVAEMVLRELEGMQQHSVYGCVKHFPGHGATMGDTHNGYAYTDKTWEELKENEAVPFQEAIEAGVSFVMVGHISTPQATGDDIPASCSKKMIGEYLRKELGYEGIVLTDALNMKAITDQYTSEEAAVMVLRAGGDMLLMPQDFKAAYEGILTAVQDGSITEERIDTSLKRILKVKMKE